MLLGSSFTILAQDIKVSGIIRDENGDGVPGATILVKGTNSGTASDVNGYYSLSAPATGILTVSYIGYQSMDISINGQSTLDITITPAASSLDEIVVIGYGSQKKRDV
ncbi:MAG: carboxypeptidase-like regulatory domain-containing protein, partial [Saprospiraceae bacterium]